MSSSTLRINFPQWQGGAFPIDQKYLPEFKGFYDRIKSYHLGSRILSFIAPKNSNQKEITIDVPFETETEENLKEKNGILAYDACLSLLKQALSKIKEENPAKILTIGGECSVSVPSFTYLIDKYKEDVGIIWIDAHPDMGMPGDQYKGYHAMALAMCLGMGDENYVKECPGKISVEKCIILGLREMEKEAEERKNKIGLKHITVEETRENKNKIAEWIKKVGVKKVLIHLDLDVLDPKDLFVAVGYVENGFYLKEVIEQIKIISENSEVVGLTIAERTPVEEIRLLNMMNQLPLFNN